MNSRKNPLLIVLIAGIGDLVLGSKSIRAMRNSFPNADIHLLTSTEAASIARNYDYLNHVWAFPIRELRKKKRYLFDILRLILELRKIQFVIAVNLFAVDSWVGAIKMGLLFLLVSARVKVGHNNKGFGLFLTEKVPAETFQNRHRVDAMKDIALQAGGRPDENGIDVFWDKSCEKKWSYLFESKRPYFNERIVGLNPGGDRENKRWNPENFAIVGDKIIEESNAKIILLGGPGEENIAGQIENKMRNGVVNLAGKLDLNELTYIISKFDLLVTNDSGPMHIAAGVRTPLVAIFGPQNPAIVGPYTSKKLYSVLYKDVNCRPCKRKKCRRPMCLDRITPNEIYQKCVELLKMSKSISSDN